MANRIEVFDVVVAANVASTSPQSNSLAFTQGEIDRIEIVWPSGCNGLVGFQLTLAKQTVIPHSASAWVRGNDEVTNWPLEGFPTTGAWAAVTYNTDVFAHTLQVRFLITELSPIVAVSVPAVPIAPAAIESAVVA